MDAMIARTHWKILAKRLEQLGLTDVTDENKAEWISEHNNIITKIKSLTQEKLHVRTN